MKILYLDLKYFLSECKKQNFGVLTVFAYLVFSYLRPQVIHPVLNIIPWTQIAIILGLMYAMFKNQLRVHFTYFIILIFALVITLSAFESQYPEISIGKIHIIYIWLVEVIFFTSCIKNLKQYYLALITLFIILFKMSFFGARVWVQRGFGFRDWGIAGPPGFFANSGEFSLLMALLAIISLAFLYGNKKTRKIYYVLPITAIMTVIGASSRGGQLALAVGMALFAVLILKLRFKTIILSVAFVILAFSLLPEQQKERFLTMGEDTTSISRLTYWKAGLDMIKKYPFLGIGYYAFPQYFHDYYSEEVHSNASVFNREEVAHNSLIEVGSSTGYLGLFCYLWLLLHCYLLNRKTRTAAKLLENDENYSWVGTLTIGMNISILVYLIGSFFMSVAFYPYVYLMVMLSLSLKNGVENANFENSEKLLNRI